jgi:hypothetical protein
MDLQPTTTDAPTPAPALEEVYPFSQQELAAMLRRPLRTMDLVLAQGRRLAANIALDHRLPQVGLVLLLTTCLFALPYAAVVDVTRIWRVPLLLLGSMAICLPSLHVFGRFIGGRLSWTQMLSVALSATAVASLFTFAFAPILGFLRVTMTGAHIINAANMSVVLLIFALGTGIVQLLRLLRGDSSLRGIGASVTRVLLPWLALYIFIFCRLAQVLELF